MVRYVIHGGRCGSIGPPRVKKAMTVFGGHFLFIFIDGRYSSGHVEIYLYFVWLMCGSNVGCSGAIVEDSLWCL